MLALIAGQGRLPVLLARQLRADDTEFRVVEMADHPFENPDGLPVTVFRLEQLGGLLDTLASDGVKDICFAGAVRRPDIDPARVDDATMPLLGKIKQAIASGDDGALRVIMALFTDRGFTVRAAQDIAPQLLPGAGVLTSVEPDPPHLKDAILGWQILDGQGNADIGQASVISGGFVLAVEGQSGTGAMLAGLESQTGGILFKGPKPNQDRRADMPTIGVDTVDNIVAAGLDGIVIEVGGVLVLDLPEVIQACDRTGVFLLVQARP